jgi:hypothetical protein
MLKQIATRLAIHGIDTDRPPQSRWCNQQLAQTVEPFRVVLNVISDNSK